MAWTCTVIEDIDKDNIGQATAVWDQGGADEFTYSIRSGFTGAAAAQFKADAIAAKDAYLANKAGNATKSTTLTTYMNA